jgi:hypothetical protein
MEVGVSIVAINSSLSEADRIFILQCLAGGVITLEESRMLLFVSVEGLEGNVVSIA